MTLHLSSTSFGRGPAIFGNEFIAVRHASIRGVMGD
jgi:hypothetical protein